MNVSNIRKAVVNGRNVKMFDVRKNVDGAMVFVGTFTAPAKTANRDLLSHIETN